MSPELWMKRFVVLHLALVAGIACSSSPAKIDGFSTAELCGSTSADFGVSPQPLTTRSSGAAFSSPSAVAVSGSPPAGALADLLANTGWKEASNAPLTLRVEGPDTLAQIQTTCGVQLPARPGSYALVTRPGTILVAGASEGQANAFATLRQLVSAGSVPSVSILDGPAVAQRIVLEGFYGPAWTWEARHKVLHAAAQQKFNVYLYAPKGDYESRFFWQNPLDPTELEAVKAFTADAASLSMQLCWELSPGGAITYSDMSQRMAMEAKLQSLMGVGVSCFILAFDDTPMSLVMADRSVYPDFATAQVDFLNAMDTFLKAQPGNARLQAVTGNAYSTLMMQAHPDYTAKLAGLDTSINLGWTGLDIISGEVTAADVAVATKLLGRPPALGDNYPVAGTDLVSGPLNWRPIDGREPAAIEALAAYGGNGMTLAQASIPAFASLAELAWNPRGYQPERAFARGLQLAAGATTDGLMFFARLTNGLNQTGMDAAPELRALLDEYGYDSSGGEPQLEAFFRRMQGIGAELTGIDAELLKEITPWINKTQAWGKLGLDVLAAAKLPSGSATPDMVAALKAELAQVEANQAVIADGPMQAFATQAIAGITPCSNCR